MTPTSADFETVEHAGHLIVLAYDECAQDLDPRQWTNVGLMVCYGHRHYTLGDEQITEAPVIECRACNGTGYRTDTAEAEGLDCPTCDGRGELEVDLATWAKAEHGATVILPLGLLDHSGLTMYVGGGAHICDPGGWDSGTCGVIFDTAERRAETGVELEQVEEALRAEVAEYGAWLAGDVCWWRVEDLETGEVLESCGGYIGDEGRKAALQEARQSAEGLEVQDRAEALEAEHWAARGMVTA